MKIIKLPQACETSTHTDYFQRYAVRYAYARSGDSRKKQAQGQDYLTYAMTNDQLVFVLCDGVSQSYFGDIAARLLGDYLLPWLLENDVFSLTEDEINEKLTDFLKQLTEIGIKTITDHKVNENIPPMVRQVLESKKQTGSETTFIAGLVDFRYGKSFFAWMGDSRLRLWGQAGEIQHLFDNQFNTMERWSTSKGLVGHLHTAIFELAYVNMLSVYSDGLSYLDKIDLLKDMSDAAYTTIIDEVGTQANSDDVSLFQIWLGTLPNQQRVLPLKPPQKVTASIVQGFLQVSWKPVSKAQTYKLRIMFNNVVKYISVIDCEWQIELNRINANYVQIEVAGFTGLEPGNWSAPVAVELPKAVHAPTTSGAITPGSRLDLQKGIQPSLVPNDNATHPAGNQSDYHQSHHVPPKKTPYIKYILSGVLIVSLVCIGLVLALLLPGIIAARKVPTATLSAALFPEHIDVLLEESTVEVTQEILLSPSPELAESITQPAPFTLFPSTATATFASTALPEITTDGEGWILISVDGFISGGNDNPGMKSFRIMKYEVTRESFMSFLDSDMAGLSRIAYEKRFEENANIGEQKDFPAVFITSQEAIGYCQWKFGESSRIPTEEQWKMAARGVMLTDYPYPNLYQLVPLELQPVYNYPAQLQSENGVFGLIGSVWEYVFSQSDPEQIVIIGGSYRTWQQDDFQQTLNFMNISQASPEGYDDETGFRCVMPVGND